VTTAPDLSEIATGAPTTGPTVTADGAPEPPTGRLRAGWRRWRWPALIAVGVVLAGVVSAALVPDTNREALDPRSAGQDGSRAVAQVLRAHGVRVELVERSADAVAGDTGQVTVVVVRPQLLGPQQLDRLAASSADLVLVEPDLPVVRALATGVSPAGPLAPDTNSRPECTDPDAVAAGQIRASGLTYALDDAAAGTAPVGCYPAPASAPGETGTRFGLVRLERDGRRVSVLGESDVLRNRALAVAGNAALALRLLGARAIVRWYLPDPTELGQSDQAPGLSDLLPRWVRWTFWQLVVVVALALLWRARRAGPVVPEPLPVVVRSAETREGRARLYRQGRSRARAAAVLRTAALRRLAVRLGVPPQAEPSQVARLAAGAAGLDPVVVQQTLLGDPPRDDAALVRLAGALDEVERRVGAGPDRYRDGTSGGDGKG
jgi:hypothetical protein